MGVRVAHIISSLGIGGAERHLVNLVNSMSCEYRAVICVGQAQSGPTFHKDLDPIVDQFRVPVRLRTLPLGIMRLASVLRRAKVNVVHTHMFRSSLYGAMAARLVGVPVVVTTEHGENPWKGWFHRLLERQLISPLAKVRFCVSPRILAIRRDRDGVPASKLRLIVNGTPLPRVSSRKSANQVPIVGAVGRLIPAKDYPGLLEAVAELRRRGYKLHLCIAGEGPESRKIQETRDRLGLHDGVTMPGMVTDTDSLYRSFDVYVSSSEREGLPIALLEAMSYGLAVVATDVGASSEVVQDGIGGVIVPPRDPVSLADALGQLLDDPDRRESLGRGARERIEEHFSVVKVADLHVNTYRELLSSRL